MLGLASCKSSLDLSMTSRPTMHNTSHTFHLSTFSQPSFILAILSYLPCTRPVQPNHEYQWLKPSTSIATALLLPPRLALPTEFKLHIFYSLEADLRPSLITLRLTHSSLRKLIPRKVCFDVRGKRNTSAC